MAIDNIGLHLKTAREGMKLTEKDVAAQLHLSPSIIQLIEKNDFTNGPPTTFLRGYVRSYARLLHFSEEDVTAIVNQLTEKLPLPSNTYAAAPPLSNYTATPLHGYLRKMTYLVIIILIVLVLFWWNAHMNYSLDHVIDKVSERLTNTPSVATSVTPTPSTITTPIPVAPPSPPPSPPVAILSPPIPTPIVAPGQSVGLPSVEKNKIETPVLHQDMALPEEPGLEQHTDNIDGD